MRFSENKHWIGSAHVRGDGRAWDWFHINSVVPDGRDLIVSSRHLDAIFLIDKASGDVIWKLAGTHTARSLRVIGDAGERMTFGGQHDGNLLPDGTLTVDDNHAPAR